MAELLNIAVWLATYFRNDDIGYNHMTFCSKKFRESENSMAKALLDGSQVR